MQFPNPSFSPGHFLPASVRSNLFDAAGLAILTLALMVTISSAQSATNFNASSPTPASPAKKVAPTLTPAAKEAGPVTATPSRFVGAAELDAYLASLTSVFSMQTRTTDPFGQLQDPNAKPVIKTPLAKTAQRAKVFQATPFSEIVRLIAVNTIMPKEKKFLVKNRTVSKGDKVSLTFRGKQIHVEVLDVTSQIIAFRNLDNGEVATRKLDILPIGMTPGSHGITAPGMAVDRQNAPIELETGEPPEETTRNAN